jgi:hypothetical protein
MQHQRIVFNSRWTAITKDGKPNLVVNYMCDQFEYLEKQSQKVLEEYSIQHPMGEWMREIKGIGPITAAGVLAHVDINKAPTFGHILSFAGMHPNVKWEKGQVRPFSALFKSIMWKIGESFVKVSGQPDAYYGKVYLIRRKLEWENNISGKLSARALEQKARFQNTDDSKHWYNARFEPVKIQDDVSLPVDRDATYIHNLDKTLMIYERHCFKIVGDGNGIPMIPPVGIYERSKRNAIKLFVAHLHHVWREYEGLPIPMPYPFAHLDHVDYVPPPVPSPKRKPVVAAEPDSISVASE